MGNEYICAPANLQAHFGAAPGPLLVRVPAYDLPLCNIVAID